MEKIYLSTKKDTDFENYFFQLIIDIKFCAMLSLALIIGFCHLHNKLKQILRYKNILREQQINQNWRYFL